MKFEEARKKLAEIANGEFHTLNYEVKTHYSELYGRQDSQECTLYIHGGDHMGGPTWEAAFAKLANSPAVSEEMPQGEVV